VRKVGGGGKVIKPGIQHKQVVELAQPATLWWGFYTKVGEAEF
jgi:hypothetical protein